MEAAEESSPLVTTAEESEEAMTQETSELAVLKETEDKTVQETAALAVALGEAEETREVAVDDERMLRRIHKLLTHCEKNWPWH